MRARHGKIARSVPTDSETAELSAISVDMKYRRFAKTGMMLSQYSLGCMQFKKMAGRIDRVCARGHEAP
jgi:hypothetical protein